MAESVEERRRRAERRAVIAERRARRRRVAYRRARLPAERVEPPRLPPPRSIALPTPPGGTSSLGVRRLRQRYRQLRRLGLDHEDAVRAVATETGRTVADVARRTKWDRKMAALQAEQASLDNHNEGSSDEH